MREGIKRAWFQWHSPRPSGKMQGQDIQVVMNARTKQARLYAAAFIAATSTFDRESQGKKTKPPGHVCSNRLLFFFVMVCVPSYWTPPIPSFRLLSPQHVFLTANENKNKIKAPNGENSQCRQLFAHFECTRQQMIASLFVVFCVRIVSALCLAWLGLHITATVIRRCLNMTKHMNNSTTLHQGVCKLS